MPTEADWIEADRWWDQRCDRIAERENTMSFRDSTLAELGRWIANRLGTRSQSDPGQGERSADTQLRYDVRVGEVMSSPETRAQFTPREQRGMISRVVHYKIRTSALKDVDPES